MEDLHPFSEKFTREPGILVSRTITYKYIIL